MHARTWVGAVCAGASFALVFVAAVSQLFDITTRLHTSVEVSNGEMFPLTENTAYYWKGTFAPELAETSAVVVALRNSAGDLIYNTSLPGSRHEWSFEELLPCPSFSLPSGNYRAVVFYPGAQHRSLECSEEVSGVLSADQLLSEQEIKTLLFYENASTSLHNLHVYLGWLVYVDCAVVVFLYGLTLWRIGTKSNELMMHAVPLGAFVVLAVLHELRVFFRVPLLNFVVFLGRSVLALLAIPLAVRHFSDEAKPTASSAIAPAATRSNSEVESVEDATEDAAEDEQDVIHKARVPAAAVLPVPKRECAASKTESLRFCCPICLMYFRGVCVSECCAQYTCHSCLAEYFEEKTGQEILEVDCVGKPLDIPCCFCRLSPVSFAETNETEEAKKYEDTPLKARQVHTIRTGEDNVLSPLKIGDSFENMKRKFVNFEAARINRLQLSDDDENQPPVNEYGGDLSEVSDNGEDLAPAEPTQAAGSTGSRSRTSNADNPTTPRPRGTRLLR